jgi:hypothetical protein
MRRQAKHSIIFGLMLAATSVTALAEDQFHFSYRHQAMSSDGLTQSGLLLLTVVNVSGQDVRELVVSIPGPNKVTYDNRAIYVGDVTEGQQVEILDEFKVPQELVNPDALEERISWRVEYTTTVGERQITEVLGEPVPDQ